MLVGIFELMNGVALYEQGKGSGRIPGEFKFDPLGFGKNPTAFARYQTSEIKNGRLAMLAFAGIVTVAAAFPDKSFPYF
jgi:Chlorophyll A-B binding protein